jgi:type IV secretion system protein VirD4
MHLVLGGAYIGGIAALIWNACGLLLWLLNGPGPASLFSTAIVFALFGGPPALIASWEAWREGVECSSLGSFSELCGNGFDRLQSFGESSNQVGSFAVDGAIAVLASYYGSIWLHQPALNLLGAPALRFLTAAGIVNGIKTTLDLPLWEWLAIVGAVGGIGVFTLWQGGKSLVTNTGKVVSGAAEVASRGKMFLLGLWFGFWGIALLMWAGRPLLRVLAASDFKIEDLFWPGIGTALGAYWLLARGLGPAWNALRWTGVSTETHGKARTATTGELRDARMIPRRNGIYLGRMGAGKSAREVGYPGSVHLLTIGPTGSGKGTGLIIPNLCDLKRSIIIIDPKGEAAAITARLRRCLGRVVILNPFQLLVRERLLLQSHGFNPLMALDPNSDHFIDDATGIAEALVRIEGSQSHWSESAQDLVAALVMYEVLARGRDATLGNVRAMLTEPYGQDSEGRPIGLSLLLQKMYAIDFPPLQAKIGRLIHVTNEMRSIISAAITQTRFLDSKPVAADLASTNDFSFADMKDEIVTVYLILPATHLITHSNWLRLIIASALRGMLTTPASRTLPPVLFLLDEFAQLGYLPTISNAMNIARTFGVQLWPIIQDLNQLKATYGDNWENFIGACGALTAFAPRDLFTADYLSRRCGNKTVIIESENERLGSSDMGRSRGPQGIPLFRPQDLMAMSSRQMLCIADPVKNPFVTQAPVYKHEPLLETNPYFQE